MSRILPEGSEPGQYSNGLSPLTGMFSALIGAWAESKKEIDRAEADRGARQRSKVEAVDKSFMVADLPTGGRSTLGPENDRDGDRGLLLIIQERGKM